MTRSSSLLTATLLAFATATTAPAVSADPIAGAAIGGGVGALAGHAVSGRNGALIGGTLGAIAGYQIGKHHHRRHYASHRYHHRPVRAYYAPRPYYYTAAPVYVHHRHRHVHYYHDRYGRPVRVVTWR